MKEEKVSLSESLRAIERIPEEEKYIEFKKLLEVAKEKDLIEKLLELFGI